MDAMLSSSRRQPLVLTVPGLDGSDPSHWQSVWEREREDCARADLGNWSRPDRNSWVSRLNIAIRGAGRPVVLAAHSLGCHAVAWWAALERPAYGDPVIGALLVAPPDLDVAPTDDRLAAFGPMPVAPLPFASIVVASQDDPYVQHHRARRTAQFWGSHFEDAGPAGHLNAESDLGDWRFGQALLEKLIGQSAGPLPRRESGAPVHAITTGSSRPIDVSA